MISHVANVNSNTNAGSHTAQVTHDDHRYNRDMAPKPLSLDTSPEIERRQVEGWRRMSSEQKAAMVSGLTQAAFDLALAGVRQRHPDASPREQILRLAAITLGPDLARRACPEVTALDLR